MMKKTNTPGRFALGVTALALTATLPALAAVKSWTGAGSTDLWSAADNWSAAPASGDDLFFDEADTGVATSGVGGTPNNVVDTAFTSSLRSLNYTNLTGFHTTKIEAPALTISGNPTVTVLQVGFYGDGGANSTHYTTISGTELNLQNTNGTVNVSLTSNTAGSHRATLDLRELTSFNAWVNIFGVGRTTAGTAYNRAKGTMYMAKTNVVTSRAEFEVGRCSSNDGSGTTELFLGRDNTFNVGGPFRTGYRKTQGLIMFQEPNSILRLQGVTGTNRVSVWSIADNGDGDTGSTHRATNDFTGGTIEALVDTLYVAKSYSGETTGGGVSHGRLAMSAGKIDANNVQVAHHTSNNGGNAVGLVEVGAGGELSVNGNLTMAFKRGTRDPEAVLNIAGGTVKVSGDIIDGGGITTINLTNGVLDLHPDGDATPGVLAVDTLNWESGTISTLGGLAGENINVTDGTKSLKLGTNALLSAGGRNSVKMMSFNGGSELILDNARMHVDLWDSMGASDMINLWSMKLRVKGQIAVEPSAASGTLPSGNYPILTHYNGILEGSAANFAVVGPLRDSRKTFSFSGSSGNSIDLVVGGSEPVALTWAGDGTANVWDARGAANWNNRTEKFYSLDTVTFDDSGSVSPAVNVTGELWPASVTVNTTKRYTWAGTGVINGNPLISINSGTLEVQMADGGTNGILGTGEIANNGTLVLNPAGVQIISNVISGYGTLEKTGPETTIPSSVNTFAGPAIISGGTVQLRMANALGTIEGPTYITNGATLDFNDISVGLEPLFVSGAGVNGQGALTDTAPSGSTTASVARDVTLVGDTTFGAIGRWDLRAASATDTGLKGNGHNLTKVGPGFVAIVGNAATFWDTALNNVEIQQGSLAFEQPCGLGNPTATITIRSNANLQFYDAKETNILNKIIVMDDGALMTPTGPAAGTGTNVFAGTIRLAGTNRVNVAGASTFYVPGKFEGTGALNKQGNGYLILQGVNTYTGNTFVTGAGMVLAAGASIANTPMIIINGGCWLQPASPLNLANQTLGGNGALRGSAIVPATGALLPGQPIGTLSISNDLSIAGTTYIDIDKGTVAVNDVINVGGSLTCGGTLVVNNIGATPLAVGDKFKIFSKATTGSFTKIESPGYTFADHVAVDGTIEVTAVTTPTTPTSVGFSVSGKTLSVNWPANYLGWRLEVQTNGVAGAWFTVPGSQGGTNVDIQIDAGQPSVFYRLVYP